MGASASRPRAGGVASSRRSGTRRSGIAAAHPPGRPSPVPGPERPPTIPGAGRPTRRPRPAALRRRPTALRLSPGCRPAALRRRPAALRLSPGCRPAALRRRPGCDPPGRVRWRWPTPRWPTPGLEPAAGIHRGPRPAVGSRPVAGRRPGRRAGRGLQHGASARPAGVRCRTSGGCRSGRAVRAHDAPAASHAPSRPGGRPGTTVPGTGPSTGARPALCAPARRRRVAPALRGRRAHRRAAARGGGIRRTS